MALPADGPTAAGDPQRPDPFDDLIEPFQHRGIDLTLGRLQAALAELGHPDQRFAAVQVAGTNGKGSICTLVAAALCRAGYRTGLYTSPHLLSWCERLRIDDSPISPAAFRRLLERLQGCGLRHQLTPFEWITAAAFVHFAQAPVDLAVLEVGLGGRLDATTAHSRRPVIGFGSIGLDHREVLGPDLASIAAEKAGVLTAGAVAISAPQPPQVAEVLAAAAQRIGAELRWVEPAEPQPDGRLAADGLSWSPSLPGMVQRSNSAVALGMLRALREQGWAVHDPAIAAGFAAARWPGRLQPARWGGHDLLLDGAHNPPAAIALRAELDQRTAQGSPVASAQTFVLGMLANKQAPEMLRALLRPRDRAWIVPVSGHASWDLQALRLACPDLAAQLLSAASVAEALDRIITRPPEVSAVGAVIVAGSLYLLADLLSDPRLETAEPH